MDSKVKPKQKRRNSERRKEKSRDAARCRRSKETEIFQDLASLLPLPSSTVSSLDKASVMRLAISYLKTQQILHIIPLPEVEVPAPSMPVPEDSLFLKALDGFVLVVSADGDLVFLSENVNEHLGLSHVELMGQSIYELTHPCDHTEVRGILSTKEESGARSIFIRLKCTLTSKGRSVNVKSAGYKVIHCTGHLVRNQQTDSDPGDSSVPAAKAKASSLLHADEDSSGDLFDSGIEAEGDQSADKVTAPLVPAPGGHCFVAIGEPIPHPANYDVPLSRTFLTKHSLDMKFTYADETMEEYLGYNPDIFITKSVFDFHHTQDSSHVQAAFRNLFTKGQCQTDRYRFLAGGGGFVWVLTQATLIYNKCQKAQSVVCVNFVISGIEQPNQIFSLCQLPKAASTKTSPPVAAAAFSKPVVAGPPDLVPIPSAAAKPQPAFKPTARVLPSAAVAKPAVATGPPKPLAAPLEKILPLPAGITIPKVTSFASLLTPLPPQNTTVPNVQRPQQNCTLADQNGTAQRSLAEPVRASAATLADQRGTSATVTPLAAADCTKLVVSSDPNSVAAKFFSTVQLESPLVRALIAESNVLATPPPPPARPQAATAKIFAPRTEEMNTGYLTFADDNTGITMLKHEPEDLTHLAPTAGDACIPLEDTSELLMGDLLDEFILPDNYCPLLSDACDTKPMGGDMSPGSHSFYTYRDDRSLSPDALTHSPDACSLPSLSSMEDSPPMMLEDSMHSLWGLELVSSSEDLSVSRAPYIPLPPDDLPLLTGDLMWGAGPTPPKPLTTSDPLLSSHSKASAWSKSTSTAHSRHAPASLHQSHQSSVAAATGGRTLDARAASSSLAKLLKSEPEDAGGGGGLPPGGVHHTAKYNGKYSNKKGSTSGGSTQSVLERKASSVPSNKRCATPPEWDHRGYWKRSRTPSATAQSGLSQAQTARHNSVLMNLLVSGCDKPPLRTDQAPIDRAEVAKRIRLKSLTALDTDVSADFCDLTTQDYEVNAPTSNLLLGEDLLSALERP